MYWGSTVVVGDELLGSQISWALVFGKYAFNTGPAFLSLGCYWRLVTWPCYLVPSCSLLSKNCKKVKDYTKKILIEIQRASPIINNDLQPCSNPFIFRLVPYWQVRSNISRPTPTDWKFKQDPSSQLCQPWSIFWGGRTTSSCFLDRLKPYSSLLSNTSSTTPIDLQFKQHPPQTLFQPWSTFGIPVPHLHISWNGSRHTQGKKWPSRHPMQPRRSFGFMGWDQIWIPGLIWLALLSHQHDWLIGRCRTSWFGKINWVIWLVYQGIDRILADFCLFCAGRDIRKHSMWSK